MDEKIAVRLLSDLLKKDVIIVVNRNEYLAEAFKIV